MQRLEVSGAVRPIYKSLGVKRLIKVQRDANYAVRPGPDLATLEGSSCTDIMTCTGGCSYSF